MSKSILTYERLRELLDYNHETGVFTWKRCDRRTDRIGQRAGGNSQHYYRINVDSVYYQAHNLAWLYTHGQWPSGQIDHINRDGRDNRLVNLRDVTPSENQHNLGRDSRNWTGTTGVGWCTQTSSWYARINVRGISKHLGRFKNIAEAIAARQAAKRLYHPSAPVAQQGA